MVAVASHLAPRPTAPCSRQRATGGPKRGWRSSQASNAGQPLPAAQADSSRNGTVGSTGKNAPTTPRAKAATASSRHSAITTRWRWRGRGEAR
jgi:hypothetical protein